MGEKCGTGSGNLARLKILMATQGPYASSVTDIKKLNKEVDINGSMENVKYQNGIFLFSVGKTFLFTEFCIFNENAISIRK